MFSQACPALARTEAAMLTTSLDRPRQTSNSEIYGAIDMVRKALSCTYESVDPIDAKGKQPGSYLQVRLQVQGSGSCAASLQRTVRSRLQQHAQQVRTQPALGWFEPSAASPVGAAAARRRCRSAAHLRRGALGSARRGTPRRRRPAAAGIPWIPCTPRSASRRLCSAAVAAIAAAADRDAAVNLQGSREPLCARGWPRHSRNRAGWQRGACQGIPGGVS